MSYKPVEFVDFTNDMKKSYTILAPDIFPMHMDLLAEIFKLYGYNVQIMRYTGKKVLDTGLKYIHNDMCYPAICSLGQLIYAVTCGDYDPHKVALIHFQTGGGCRASNYIKLLKKALRNLGMEYIPIISLNFNNLEKHSGFKLTLPMLYKGFVSLLYSDMLMLLRNQVRPYEITKGESDMLAENWKNELLKQFNSGKGLNGKSIKANLNKIARDFSEIKQNKAEKVKVGIVGEIYVKYSSLGNNGLEKFLQSQDCEYMIPGVLGFLQYCASGGKIDFELYGGSRYKKYISIISERFLRHFENMELSVLKSYPCFTAPSTFDELLQKGDEILNKGVKMGEGWLLTAEMVELIEKGYSNVICTQPFGCLPNHIVGKGVVRRIKEEFPKSNICPIDYDAGATKVNQENRIKLMLAVGKENIEDDKETAKEITSQKVI